MVMASAKNSKESNSKRAVIATVHINNGICSNLSPVGHMLITVIIKLIAPKIEETLPDDTKKLLNLPKPQHRYWELVVCVSVW